LKIILNGIVNHKELNRFFNTTDKVELERKIITAKGKILIPDRLNINKSGSICIIDYKTGAHHHKHETQINSYGLALIEMGYSISEKIIIYCSTEGITIKKV
jgi:RecB family exonuclease